MKVIYKRDFELFRLLDYKGNNVNKHPELQHMLVDIDNNRIVVCNGYSMIVKKLEEKDDFPAGITEITQGKFLIPYELKNLILKSFVSKFFDYAFIGLKNNKPVVAIPSFLDKNNPYTFFILEKNGEDITYPNIDHLFEKEKEEPVYTIAFTIELIKNLFETLQKCQKDCEFVSLKFYGQKDPIYINNLTDYRIVFMPAVIH